MFGLLDVAKDVEVEVLVAVREDATHSDDSCNKCASSLTSSDPHSVSSQERFKKNQMPSADNL